MRPWLPAVLLAAIVGHGARARASSPALEAYDVAPTDAALAGISSGGFMAVQLQVADSATFTRGVAVFAGGPFDCSQGSAAAALGTCGQAYPSAPSAAALEAITDAWAQSGELDPTSNLAGMPVWLWSGTLDSVVRQPVMDALAAYERHYGAQVTYAHTTAAGHAWISPLGPNACAVQLSPYVNDCGIDPEQQFLTLFWGPLQPETQGAPSGQVLAFDQREFLADHDAAAHSLDATGYVFVPADCAQGSPCHLLVALHGCDQSHGQVGQAFIQDSGLLGWADANRIVVLFPQAAASAFNAQGCWDWWGYDDPNFAKKSGRQVQAIAGMVARVTSGFAPTGAGASSGSSSGSSTSGAAGSAGSTGSGASSGSSAGSSTSGAAGSTGAGASSGSSASGAGSTQGAGSGAAAAGSSGSAGARAGGCEGGGPGPAPLALLAALGLAARRERRGR